MKRILFGFERTQPTGPSNHLLRLLVTQSSNCTMPTIPPFSKSSGTLTPRCRANNRTFIERPLGGKVGAGLDQKRAAIPRFPATILNVLVAMDNQPRPWLANDDYFHAACLRLSIRAHFVYPTLNTFITSSPRWLITFTAIRPDFGLSNGRDVSLFSVAQASSLISALSVVLSALYGSFAPRK